MSQMSADYFTEEQEKPIDFKYYLHLILKNSTTIITFFIIAVTLGAIYASKIPDTYTASAQVIFEKPAASQAMLGTGAMMDDAYFVTEIEIMRSKNVLLRVVKDLKLIDYFGVESEEEAVRKVLSMLSVSRSSGMSRIFNITIKYSDPQIVANIANAVARGYIRVNFENSLYYSKEILNWIPQENGSASETVTVQDPDGSVRQVRRSDLMESLPAFQSDPTLKELKQKESELESEIDYLKRQYREKHPVMIKSRANLKFIQDTLNSQKKQILEDLKSQAQGEHKVTNARLLEEAKVPIQPLPIARSKYIVIVGLAEIFLSFILVILIDFFDHTIKSMEDLERKGVIMPFLGHLPLLKKKNRDKNTEVAIPVFLKETPEIEEAFRYIRVAINFSGPPETLKTLVFSSCLPHEGKSFISCSIAVSLASDGNKTLLLDCDMRRPVVHKSFKADNNVGLTNYLTSNIDFESVLKESFMENLTLVTSGPISPNPTQILGSARMKQFLEEARKRFDRIIIDCPPMTGIGDAVVVGSIIGQLIMVIGAGQTPIDLIKQNQKQLEKANVKILGAILNMVDMQKERHSGYYKHYHHTYNRYYSAEQQKS